MAGSASQLDAGGAEERRKRRRKDRSGPGQHSQPRPRDLPPQTSTPKSSKQQQPKKPKQWKQLQNEREETPRDPFLSSRSATPADETNNESSDELDKFLTQNIPAMATAGHTDQITKKRNYVTKTNKEWTVNLKPLYKQLELVARKALLITCDKTLMPKCINFCFAQFEGPESQWIIDLAVKRFRVNCNSWKSRYIKSVKAYIIRLETKEPVLMSVDSHKDLQAFFSQRFSIEMFYTVCNWVHSWIDLESSIKEHPEVKVWCAYIFTEICVCVKRYLNWRRAYESGETITKTQWDWDFVLSRFDNLYIGADESWELFKIKELSWLHNACKAERLQLMKEEKPVLQPKDDEFALKPNAAFLSALSYAPELISAPKTIQTVKTTTQPRQRSRQDRHPPTQRNRMRLEKESGNHLNSPTLNRKRASDVLDEHQRQSRRDKPYLNNGGLSNSATINTTKKTTRRARSGSENSTLDNHDGETNIDNENNETDIDNENNETDIDNDNNETDIDNENNENGDMDSRNTESDGADIEKLLARENRRVQKTIEGRKYPFQKPTQKNRLRDIDSSGNETADDAENEGTAENDSTVDSATGGMGQ